MMTRPQLPRIRDVHPGTDPDDHSKGSVLLQLSTDARRGRIALTAAVLIASAVLPATASAGTVTLQNRSIDYTANAGETNNVTLTRVSPPEAQAVYQVQDTVGLVAPPEGGCTQVDANTATCSLAPGVIFAGWNVDVLDQSDIVTNNTALFSDQNGGDGEDQLFGGSGPDFLFDGAGVDFVSGRGGNDRLLILSLIHI